MPNENPRVHGALEVDPFHPHHFRYEDGERPFVLGYEANWLWALGFLPDGEAQLRRFCARIAGYGYNHVFVNAYAHDTTWAPGQSHPEDYGPPPVRLGRQQRGAGPHPPQRPLLAGLRPHDGGPVRARAHGAPLPQGLQQAGDLARPRSAADDLFFKYVIARYGATPMWCGTSPRRATTSGTRPTAPTAWP